MQHQSTQRIAQLVAAAAALLVAGDRPAAGASQRSSLRLAAPMPPSRMPLVERARWQARALAHYRGAATVFARAGKQRALSFPERSHARWFRAAVGWTTRELGETRAAIAARAWIVPRPWDALSGCESGGRWNYSPYAHGRLPYSGFDGGLQFDPGTWAAFRRPGEPARAYLATPTVQVRVATRVLAVQGWAAWPACSLTLGLRT